MCNACIYDLFRITSINNSQSSLLFLVCLQKEDGYLVWNNRITLWIDPCRLKPVYSLVKGNCMTNQLLKTYLVDVFTCLLAKDDWITEVVNILWPEDLYRTCIHVTLLFVAMLDKQIKGLILLTACIMVCAVCGQLMLKSGVALKTRYDEGMWNVALRCYSKSGYCCFSSMWK